MANRGNKRWRCVEIANDGTQCGATTQVWLDGRPICFAHRKKIRGEAFPNLRPFTKTGERKDELTILEDMFDSSKDPNAKRQLAETIFGERRKREVGCAICRQRRDDEAAREENDQFVLDRMTVEQAQRWLALAKEMYDIKKAGESQPKREGALPPFASWLSRGSKTESTHDHFYHDPSAPLTSGGVVAEEERESTTEEPEDIDPDVFDPSDPSTWRTDDDDDQ